MYCKSLYSAKYIVLIMTEKIDQKGSARKVYRAIQSDGLNWFFTRISRAIMGIFFFDHRYAEVTGLAVFTYVFLKEPAWQSVIYPRVGCATPAERKVKSFIPHGFASDKICACQFWCFARILITFVVVRFIQCPRDNPLSAKEVSI